MPIAPNGATLLDGNLASMTITIGTLLAAHAAGGTAHEVRARDYPGSDTRPATWDDAADKFRRCSQRVLTPERQRRVIRAVQTLDTQADAGELMALVQAD